MPALALERENKILKNVANPVVEGDLCKQVQETCDREVGMRAPLLEGSEAFSRALGLKSLVCRKAALVLSPNPRG